MLVLGYQTAISISVGWPRRLIMTYHYWLPLPCQLPLFNYMVQGVNLTTGGEWGGGSGGGGMGVEQRLTQAQAEMWRVDSLKFQGTIMLYVYRHGIEMLPSLNCRIIFLKTTIHCSFLTSCHYILCWIP